MSDNQNSDAPAQTGTMPAVSNPISTQPTGLVETTFAETLGLSMHNAVTSQQSSQMTTAASITNACARLLQASSIPASRRKAKDENKEAPGTKDITQGLSAEKQDAPPPKRKFNIMNFIKKKKNDSAQSGADTQPSQPDDEAEAITDGKEPSCVNNPKYKTTTKNSKSLPKSNKTKSKSLLSKATR